MHAVCGSPLPTYQEAAGVMKCLRFAINAHSHVCNKQIHEDLDVQFFRQNVIERTERFDSKLAHMGDTEHVVPESWPKSPESLAEFGLKSAGQPKHSALTCQSIEGVVPSILRPL